MLQTESTTGGGNLDVLWIGLSIGLGLGALALLVFWIVRYSRAKSQERTLAWTSAARAHGDRFVEPEGPWYRRRAERIEGQREGVPFVLDWYVVSHGKSSTTYTRVVAGESDSGSEKAKLSIGRRGFFTNLGRAFGMQYVDTGDAHFDADFVVRAKPPELVERYLGPRTRELVAQLPKHTGLSIEQGVTTVTKLGVSCLAAELEQLIACAVAPVQDARRSGSRSRA